MAITAITRDSGINVCIVRITSTDTLAVIGSTDYLLDQQFNIEVANGGEFSWLNTDFVLVFGSDGWGLFTISTDFQSLNLFTNGESPSDVFYRAPVIAASTANIDGTYYNGPNNDGIGATFTYTATGAQLMDTNVQVISRLGYSYALKDQSSALQNGLFDCIITGASGVSTVLQRRSDFNNASNILQGAQFTVISGVENGGTSWFESQTGIINVGTDPITFSPLSAVADTGVVGLYTAQQNFARQSLTDAASVSWNLNSQQVAYLLTTAGVGATRAIAAPTNMVNGGTYVLTIQESSAGTNAVTWNAVFKWPGGVAPTQSSTANAIDIYTFVSDGTNMYGVQAKGFA